ncbi:WD40/YVTN/BNR-like repeat-containing protein [Bacteroidota bacterium]
MKTIFCLLFLIVQSQAQENWNIVNSGTTDNLTDVCFIDNQYGWIIGISGTLLRTTDAGESWHSTIIPYQNLNAMQFVNQNIGWIVGYNGLIIKSTDGGSTWFEQIGGQDYTLRDLHFFNDQVGIICGGGRLLEYRKNTKDK